jgi:hypothetical protein
LGPLLGVIDQLLADDQTAPTKQRHAVKGIFERLPTSTATRDPKVRSCDTWPRTTTEAVRYSCRFLSRPAKPSSTSVRH